MSTESIVLEPTDAVRQLLSCFEILMEEVDFHQDTAEWFAIDDELRHKITPPSRPTPDELKTAMWEVVELGMSLLEDHLALVQLFEAAADQAQQAEAVSEIIRPSLIVPGQ